MAVKNFFCDSKEAPINRWYGGWDKDMPPPPIPIWTKKVNKS